MRHGCNRSILLVNGYKRHILHDLDSSLVRAVELTAANAPEASVTEAINEDRMQQKIGLKELHIDRAHMSNKLVQLRGEQLEIYWKA